MSAPDLLSSLNYSRVEDVVQVAPYLTHVVRHHGERSLVSRSLALIVTLRSRASDFDSS